MRPQRVTVRGRVELARVTHAKSLVWPLAVIAIDELVELRLLLKEVLRRGLGRFLLER
jgi:hypothetical protein